MSRDQCSYFGDLQALRGVACELKQGYRHADFGENAAENEILAHLAIPLLRLIGWPPKQIALGWRYCDVVVFSKTPRAPENCRLIVEAKYPGYPLAGVESQAIDYAQRLQTKCDLLITDGFEFKLYRINGETWSEYRSAQLYGDDDELLDFVQLIKPTN